MVDVGQVRTFREPKRDKWQALKPLEEATEAFAAWQALESCKPESHEWWRALNTMAAECADVVQATCNLLAAYGISEFKGDMRDCETRNRFRGREYQDD